MDRSLRGAVHALQAAASPMLGQHHCCRSRSSSSKSRQLAVRPEPRTSSGNAEAVNSTTRSQSARSRRARTVTISCWEPGSMLQHRICLSSIVCMHADLFPAPQQSAGPGVACRRSRGGRRPTSLDHPPPLDGWYGRNPLVAGPDPCAPLTPQGTCPRQSKISSVHSHAFNQGFRCMWLWRGAAHPPWACSSESGRGDGRPLTFLAGITARPWPGRRCPCCAPRACTELCTGRAGRSCPSGPAC